MKAGNYTSKITDVREVLDTNGNLEALDFYHELTDGNGNVQNVRFRYYDKELPSLAKELSQYPQVKTWQDAIGLEEQITVAPKPTGKYMRIADRSALEESESTSGASKTQTSATKKGGLTSRLGGRSQTPSAQRQALLSEDDDDDNFDYLHD